MTIMVIVKILTFLIAYHLSMSAVSYIYTGLVQGGSQNPSQFFSASDAKLSQAINQGSEGEEEQTGDKSFFQNVKDTICWKICDSVMAVGNYLAEQARFVASVRNLIDHRYPIYNALPSYLSLIKTVLTWAFTTLQLVFGIIVAKLVLGALLGRG